MKQFMYSVFIAFWSSVATILMLAALSPENEKAVAEKPGLISARELAKHDKAADCWMAIEGGVYNFTDYIPIHPTAPAVLTEWCGKEATEAFNTKGYGRPHSPSARAMLPHYFVGNLVAE